MGAMTKSDTDLILLICMAARFELGVELLSCGRLAGKDTCGS
jgi:hypothetical protein